MSALLWTLLACNAQPPDSPPPPAAEPPPAAVAEPAAPATLPDRVTARHILVAYKGASRSDSPRSRDEARARAEKLRARVRAEPETFAEVAVEHSDGPSGVLGGHLGSFEQGIMSEPFEHAAFRLPVGGVSAVVETPFGFHVIQRLPSEEIRVAHVLVQWAGVPRSSETRTQDDARARAEAALARLQAGDPIDTVARDFSDGPNAVRGGDLGWFQRGQLVPAFDDAAFDLEPGQSTGIVESPLGYHIIQRLE